MGSRQALKHATIFKVLVKGLKENWDRVSSKRGGNQESVVPGSASRRQTSQEGGRAWGINCCCKLIKRRVRLRNAHFISNMAPQGTLTRLLSATWKYQKSIIMGQEWKWHEKAEAGGWFGSIGGRSCLAVCWASGLPHQDPVLLGGCDAAQDSGSTAGTTSWGRRRHCQGRSGQGAERSCPKLSCFPCQSTWKVTEEHWTLINGQYLYQILWEATGRNWLGGGRERE